MNPNTAETAPETLAEMTLVAGKQNIALTGDSRS